MTSTPAVCAIVVNWHRCTETLACLASLAQSTYPASIVVVDNASQDGSVQAIRNAYPRIDLIESTHNLGFVGGCNLGIERARDAGVELVLFLNNDAEIAPDALALLVAALQANAHVGAVGPTIFYHDDPHRIWSAGGRIDWRSGATTMLDGDRVDPGFGVEVRPVDFVSGCALLTRLSVIDQIGSFDPRFFAYYEETEWCVRAARAGYAMLHVPAARVWHRARPSTEPTSLLTHYYMTRNRLLFLAASRAGIGARARTLITYARTLMSWTVRPKWRRRRPHRSVMLHAIYDYFRGRLGRAEWVEQLPLVEGHAPSCPPADL